VSGQNGSNYSQEQQQQKSPAQHQSYSSSAKTDPAENLNVHMKKMFKQIKR